MFWSKPSVEYQLLKSPTEPDSYRSYSLKPQFSFLDREEPGALRRYSEDGKDEVKVELLNVVLRNGKEKSFYVMLNTWEKDSKTRVTIFDPEENRVMHKALYHATDFVVQFNYRSTDDLYQKLTLVIGDPEISQNVPYRDREN